MFCLTWFCTTQPQRGVLCDRCRARMQEYVKAVDQNASINFRDGGRYNRYMEYLETDLEHQKEAQP